MNSCCPKHPEGCAAIVSAGIAAAGAALPIGAVSLATPAMAQTAQRRDGGSTISQAYTIGKRKLGSLQVSELGVSQPDTDGDRPVAYRWPSSIKANSADVPAHSSTM